MQSEYPSRSMLVIVCSTKIMVSKNSFSYLIKCVVMLVLVSQLHADALHDEYEEDDAAIVNLTVYDVVHGPFSLDETVGAGIEIDPTQWPGRDCLRQCTVGSPPRICYYKFVLEHYQAMGP